MDFKDMQSGRFSGVQPEKVSTGNPEPRQPNTPPYVKGEVNPKLIEQPQIYSRQTKAYATKYGVKLALNLESALDDRAKGEITLTIREVDVAARLGIPLDRDFIHKALRAIGGMVIEGIPGEPDNPYFLRAYYNRGIKFKKKDDSGKSDYDRAHPAKQEKADALLKEILQKLRGHQLAAWPEEEANGFPLELCKPEYMTWDQFNKAQAQVVKRYDQSSDVPDEKPLTGVSLVYGPEQTESS